MKLATVVLSLLALAVPVSAQTVRIDEGSFRITIGGRDAGMETFSIRQNGTGADAVVIAHGRVVLEDAGEFTANVQLSGEAVLRPVAYDVELKGPDARRIRATVSGSRASARTTSSAGETMKEYLVGDGAVLLDDGVAYLYHFLAQRAAAGVTRVPVMNPRESRQVQATLNLGAAETISIAGSSVQARRLTVEPAGGDPRTAWVDSAGKVLRVEVPARGYVATRTALP